MTHKYDIGDIFAREYSNGNISYYMVIEVIDDPSIPMYEFLKFDDNDYDICAETWFDCLKKLT